MNFSCASDLSVSPRPFLRLASGWPAGSATTIGSSISGNTLTPAGWPMAVRMKATSTRPACSAPISPGVLFCSNCDLHLRIGAPKRSDRLRRKRMKAGRGRQSDPDFALLAARHANDGIDGPLDARKYRCRLVAQGQARFRQFDATRLAPEQLRAERPFEQLDLLAQRGLLNAKPRRGAGDVQFLGDDEKVAEQAEVHRHIHIQNIWIGLIPYIGYVVQGLLSSGHESPTRCPGA